MNVVIFGSYNGGSIGDTAILLGLISALHRVCGAKVSVSVLSMGEIGIQAELDALEVPCTVREVPVYKAWHDDRSKFGKMINRGWRGLKRFSGQAALNRSAIRRELASADLLLVGGGNLVMDLFPRWPTMLSYVCDLAVEAEVPYHLLGVGAAPIDTDTGRTELLRVLNNADSVTFRDSVSRTYCEQVLAFTDGDTGPDLAFGIKPVTAEDTRKADQLMLNLAALYSPAWPEQDPALFKRYIDQYLSLTLDLCSRLNIEQVAIFNSNYPLDQLAVNAFCREFERLDPQSVKLSVMNGRYKVADLITACSEARYALVTRLHAGILSKISGARLFAIAYQPKVRDVLEHQTCHSQVVTLEDFLAGSALKAFSSIDFTSPTPGSEPEPKVTFRDVDRLILSITSSVH